MGRKGICSGSSDVKEFLLQAENYLCAERQLNISLQFALLGKPAVATPRLPRMRLRYESQLAATCSSMTVAFDFVLDLSRRPVGLAARLTAIRPPAAANVRSS